MAEQNLDQEKVRQYALSQGLSMSDLQEILQDPENAGLVDKLSEAFGADLMSDRYAQMGNAPIQGSRDGVGPYGMTVATPWTAAAGGLERGIGRYMEKQGVDTQQDAQRGIIDALRTSSIGSQPSGERPPAPVTRAGAMPPVPMPDGSGHPGMMGEAPIMTPEQQSLRKDPGQAVSQAERDMMAQATPRPAAAPTPTPPPQAMPPAGGGPLGGPAPMVPPMINPGGTAAGMPEPQQFDPSGMGGGMPVAQPPGPAGRPGGNPAMQGNRNTMDVISALRDWWGRGQGPTGR